MHFWFVLILFGSLLVHILSRPQHAAEYNNDSYLEEVEEDKENDAVAEEFLTDDDDSRAAEQESALQEEELPQNTRMIEQTGGSRYLQRGSVVDHLARNNVENLSGFRTSRNRDARQDPGVAPFHEQVQSLPRRQSNRYNTDSNDDQQEATEHLSNRDVYKPNHLVQGKGEIPIDRRTVEFEGQSNEEGDMLFEKNRDQISKVNRNENNNNNEASDTNEQARYFKQYYNTIQGDTIEGKCHDGSARFNFRDRRDVKEANPPETPTTDTKASNDKIESEDEESAIKRHIKKLSGDELNQLLNSLTDDRRQLLKKIIDDVDTGENSGSINKREITKKEGAVEENNFIENCQSDLSKVQGGSISELNNESASSSNTVETTDMSKQPELVTERGELSTSKSTETNLNSANKMEMANNEENLQKAADSLHSLALNVDTKSQGKIVGNAQGSSKAERKRETNLDDMEDISVDESKTIDNDLSLENGQDYANDQEGYDCSRGESSSKLLSDEPQFDQDSKEYKRETNLEKQADLSDSMKSLEESFPNSNAYDDSVPYSGPLVRVKRKDTDQVVKKRSAGLFPDAKVGYFPYKAENEDEDNDEGNEFDDEGFYDRTSNFANIDRNLEEGTANADQSVRARSSDVDNSKAASHENLEGDTMNVGSDSDGVLSGVEGVDDNLMYNSDARNRRTAENNKDVAKEEPNPTSVLLENEKKSGGDNFFNAPNYQENDAFGPLPRNYDGDLNRYKRIRRVKQSHNAQEPTSTDG